MNFSLTPNLEQYVRDRASSGDYNNASEVVREALRLMKRVEERRSIELERLRNAVREGDEALATGDFVEIVDDETLDRVFAEL
ncbi:MAG: type II toxin-antitoxin system ParD family antitoxin [Rhodospirillaceae bacterium]|jgi:antitoxin ParD1/3/4|nr:type II toxin-antitoxin system ParD family antitoxin [Rhodospirillaceae bacterium]MBT6140019.1 type II toxin-antitoxin system ParD family antitoxin [Rhodospirillaceae bacterium]